MNIYTVSAFGRFNMVSCFGGLGPIEESADGGISFNNPTAGAYFGESVVVAEVGPSGRGGDPLPSWLSWTNNSINTVAYGAYAAGGSAGMLTSGAVRYYSNAWKGNQYIKTFNLTKLGTNVGYGTSTLGFGFGMYNFAVSDKSWGDYGQLGISLLSSGLTLSGYTAPIGIGIGFIDVAGGFNGFYNYLDTQQHFYNSTGGVMLPVNGIPTFIPLRKL
jgi:hypothetical protein